MWDGSRPEHMKVFRGANVKLENWRQVTVLKLTITEKGHNCVREPATHQVLMENNLRVSKIHPGACTVTACRTNQKCE